ncbi:hypothetical protein Poly30_31550 [Planctomycetes bacterium Poly30]|uniref:DUF58 domain-containing protein n=1 Tax=Saltatorellus ferox TaxID=2528018 RepID=A0A518EU54_9BACT|nr:hypothetical protein Poly30_31550 [Planctomycetes bacterium Poly30]
MSAVPGVEFTPDLIRRIATFAGRLAAAREREDVGSKRALQGEGQEFVGHRPYRPGEDLRQLDWELLARLDRPFVRILRSNASEAWVVVIDTSASMAIGRPGKLQSAAEAAAASISLGLRLGAEVTLVWFQPEAGLRTLHVGRSPELERMFAALGDLRTFGSHDVASSTPPAGGIEAHLVGPSATVPGLVRRRSGAGRVFLFGDFIDVQYDAVLQLAGGRRRVHLGQVLSPEEWNPAEAVTWVDPETGERHPGASGGPARLGAYRRRLERFVEGWEVLARAHAMGHAAWSSADPFERFLPALLR